MHPLFAASLATTALATTALASASLTASPLAAASFAAATFTSAAIPAAAVCASAVAAAAITASTLTAAAISAASIAAATLSSAAVATAAVTAAAIATTSFATAPLTTSSLAASSLAAAAVAAAALTAASVSSGSLAAASLAAASLAPTTFSSKGLAKALPPVLFSTFCLCAPTASAIFKTWDCVEYVDDSFVSTNDDSDTLIWDRAGTRFLRGDLRTTCNTFNGSETTMLAEYTNIRNIAWVFAFIYAIILPCIFMGLLLPSHKALRQRRSTQLVRATDFLHREYRPEYFCAAPRGSNPGLAAQTCTQV